MILNLRYAAAAAVMLSVTACNSFLPQMQRASTPAAGDTQVGVAGTLGSILTPGVQVRHGISDDVALSFSLSAVIVGFGVKWRALGASYPEGGFQLALSTQVGGGVAGPAGVCSSHSAVCDSPFDLVPFVPVSAALHLGHVFGGGDEFYIVPRYTYVVAGKALALHHHWGLAMGISAGSDDAMFLELQLHTNPYAREYQDDFGERYVAGLTLGYQFP